MGNSGWNRPAANQPTVKKGGAKAPNLGMGILAGLVCVVIALGVMYFMRDVEKPVEKAPKKPTAIKEVTPATAPAAKAKEPTNAEKLRAKYVWASIDIPDDWDKPYPPQAYRPDGTLKRYSKYVHVVTNKRSKISMSLAELTFSQSSDRAISNLLTVRPGEQLVGDITYDEGFMRRFLKSLETPIVIDEQNDTAVQKELKRLVIETRNDLKARHDAGEDIVAIMNETRQQLRELGIYREEIKKMVSDARKQSGEMSEQDERDLIAAANKMLADRGCEPLRDPRIFLQHVEMGEKLSEIKQGEKK